MSEEQLIAEINYNSKRQGCIELSPDEVPKQLIQEHNLQ
jgi:hypothetical protein